MTDVEGLSFREPKDMERWLGSSAAPEGKKESDGSLVMVSMVMTVVDETGRRQERIRISVCC